MILVLIFFCLHVDICVHKVIHLDILCVPLKTDNFFYVMWRKTKFGVKKDCLYDNFFVLLYKLHKISVFRETLSARMEYRM
jgi:hypothetical protein